MYNNITTFIHNLFGTDELAPLHAPLFIGNEKKYLAECIDTTFVSSVGKFVDRFEEQVASYTGSERAVVCVSGTNALHMGMLLVGVERDDEVLTQALTFIATCNAISYIGAHPVFLDVDRDTLGLSPLAVKRWLSTHAEVRNGQCYNKKTGRRIKACVPMHTFGHPMKIDELSAVCNKYHIELVEDAAESIGSFYKGRHTGTFGRVGAIGFNGNKTITTGGGGMLLFQDEELGKFAKHLTTQAKVPTVGHLFMTISVTITVCLISMPHWVVPKWRILTGMLSINVRQQNGTVSFSLVFLMLSLLLSLRTAVLTIG